MQVTTPDGWKAEIDAAIAQTIDATAAATSPATVHGELIDELRTSAAGGKRLRALVLLAAHEGAGAASHDAALAAAAALELFQAAALIHDDLLDDSDTRRGKPAAHLRLAGVADGDWLVDARRFGADSAVLLGDLALMCAHRAMSRSQQLAGAERGAAAATAYADMAELVTVGQYLDMRIAAQPVAALATQRDDIWATMRSKTASYSAEAPLVLGGIVGGASDAQVAHLRQAGVPLGLAFQLRDDILGLTGAEADTGKPAGDDLREGKRTVLVHHAWQAGDDSVRALLTATLGNADASTAEVAEAIAAVVATGAVEAAQSEIESLTARGLDALAAAGLDPEADQTLRDIFVAAVSRTR